MVSILFFLNSNLLHKNILILEEKKSEKFIVYAIFVYVLGIKIVQNLEIKMLNQINKLFYAGS